MSNNYRELTVKELDLSTPMEDIRKYREKHTDVDVIGQPRALRALQFGMDINEARYNIFITGEPGTGRHTTVKNLLTKYKNKKPLKDIACVCNFADPDSPDILYFPKGKATLFKEALKNFILLARNKIRLQIENNIFKNEKEKLIKRHEKTENKYLDDFEEVLAKDHFVLVSSDKENDEQLTEIMPLYDGNATNFDELHDLLQEGKITKNEWESLRTRYYRHMDKLQNVLRQMQSNKAELEEKIRNLQKKHVKPFLETGLAQLRESFKGKDINQYLTSLQNDILDKLDLFIDDEPDKDALEAQLIRYEINIISDNSKTKNCPVIYETHPTYTNLFGTIEYRTELNGETRTNFTMIKAGSMIKASGGFVIINAEDLFQDENSWEYMKRTLKNEEIQVQSLGNPLNMVGISLKPKPVKIDVKVILIGSEKIYDLLYETDEDFGKFFKISAEFDSEMPFTQENAGQYVYFIQELIRKKKFKSISDQGINYIIKYGKKLTEDRNKLTTRFSKISDILTEANYWARQMGLKQITEEALKRAEDEKKYFESLQEEKLLAMLFNGTIKIQVQGSRVGAINALTVLSRGSYSYGHPSLLTATCSAGDDGIINIENEAGLSGEIFNKSVMIIEGFLRHHYSDNFLMSFRASLCFEQSYGMIDGDSASSTEIYALLSAVTGIPLRQDIAVTGSVNQFGEIQPVGGVSEKITGFFEVCEKLGMTGTQGVIVPETNINNILLPDNILDAIGRGVFHIYPVTSINQGIEILTGMKADDFNAQAVKKFKELSKKAKDSK
ncbi:MAG: AAA family ATPase [Spirochaetia bacterium]|nr:AAA family ATPase [Spirochaetia bacterium]